MPNFLDGFKRAGTEIISGVVMSVIANAFASSYSWVPWLFLLITLLGDIILASKIPYWGTGYLIGWLIGCIWLGWADLLGIGGLALYIFFSAVILIRRY